MRWMSSSIESMARERNWAWHETLKQIKCPGLQSSSKMAPNNCSSCGTVTLGKNLWPVSVAWVFDDRDTLRCTRHIVGSPHTSFRRKPTRHTAHNVCSVFCWGARTDPVVSMRDGLPTDQPPHLQHQSVESRKPNWCER